jgi:IS4 transposase
MLKKKVVDKVIEMGFSFISKLRSDADMKYFYEAEHEKRKGAKKKYEGKVIWKDCFERFNFVATLENGIKLYSKDRYSVGLKRQLWVVVLQTYNKKGKMSYALLFSTNTEQDPREIYHYYRLRFAIEFLFRDAKSHLGLQHCQAREEDKLCFHFKFVFLVLNLAKWEILQSGKSSISIADLKSEYFNPYVQR